MELTWRTARRDEAMQRLVHAVRSLVELVVVVADGRDASRAFPLGSTFPFSACCHTGHLAIHLGPVLLITRLGLRMRTTRPVVRRRPVPWKGVPVYQEPPSPLYLPLFLPCPLSTSFFTPVATKGPLSVGRRARLFYTPNVIQKLQSYLKLLSRLSSLRSASVLPLFIRELCFSFGLKCFWNVECGEHTRDEEGERESWREGCGGQRYQEKLY